LVVLSWLSCNSPSVSPDLSFMPLLLASCRQSAFRTWNDELSSTVAQELKFFKKVLSVGRCLSVASQFSWNIIVFYSMLPTISRVQSWVCAILSDKEHDGYFARRESCH
jgi:hypothetical protein